MGSWYNFFIKYAIPAQVAILVTWWFYQVIQADPTGWWNPFSIETVGTCILQWIVLISILMGANRFFNKRIIDE